MLNYIIFKKYLIFYNIFNDKKIKLFANKIKNNLFFMIA